LGGDGLYIGCGNGRNYLPLVDGGLDLVGLDVSAAALAKLAERAPGRSERLIHGDLRALPPSASYRLVIGIQVFSTATGQRPTRTSAPPKPGSSRAASSVCASTRSAPSSSTPTRLSSLIRTGASLFGIWPARRPGSMST